MAKRAAVKPVTAAASTIDAVGSIGTKGDRTRRAIIDAVNDIVAREGMTAVSQDNVARLVGISQSALRHHYPTKESLVRAVVDDQLAMFRRAMERLLLKPGSGTPASRLARMIDSHFERVSTHSEAMTFEVYAHWARNADARKPAHEWFAWLSSHYAELIHAIRPSLTPADCSERALQIITLCLGAWTTLSQTRPLLTDRAAGKVRRSLQRGVDSLVGVELPWET